MTTGNVTASAFRTSGSVPGYPQFNAWVSPSGANLEPAFQNVWSALSNSAATTTRFLRNDALLVVFLLSNGEDTTGWSYSDVWGGCDATCTANRESSFNLYRSRFAGLKANPAQVKWYSAVANQSTGYGAPPCLQGNSFTGTRYMRMASEMGGASFDLCRQPVAEAVESFAAYLQNIRLSYRTRYIFVSQEPDFERDYSVTKTTGGVSYDVPEDPDNGWTYHGWVDNVYAIDSPTPMALTSGYAFRLNGSAALLGDDTASVQYYVVGAQDSIAE